MSPKPQDGSPAELLDNAIVISGMAGLYPESQNVKDFRDILYNKVNPVTSKDCRWKYDHPEVAQYTGKVPGLDLFDAQFFKVHYRLGNTMDSMSRKLLEQSFEAIYDAGVNSDQLSGKKVGVYVGSCFSETEKYVFYISNSKTGFGIMGSSKTMFANRISYWLNTKGPSMSIDQSCCSSVLALELAYQAMNRGDVDAALVGGASLCLLPQSSVHLRRVVLLSRDGKTRSFDKNACGCAKSEAINVLFVQKAKDARRIYAEVVYAKSEFSGFVNGQNGPKYGFYREPEKLESFLNQFYKEAQVDPKEVQYVEAAGSATPEADKAELEAIDKVFCRNRSDPLHVGSVMSNIGYGEAASGISSITKVLLGYESGLLASNLHCDNLRDDLEGIEKGVMRFVTDHQPFGRGYTAINNLSVTGVNAHVLLKGHYKPKNLNRYKSNIPHLVTISGRQQSSVEKILNDLKSRPIDPEEIALLHNIHQNKISGHMGRGYVILDTTERKETVTVAEKADYFDDVTNPLWFVYSGMGSQWAGMGTELMRIPVFANAIQSCHEILKPKGLDLINIITSPDKKIFDNILHSFVGIAAVQIGLTDVLTELGIAPDKIIGHSVGELGCAYADGCLTAEETILSAYSRGLVSVQTPFIKGSMAAVGLGYSQVAKMCPPEVEIACHNSSESATISGPADIMQELVASFTAKGIFAKEVPCSNIAYHSRYIANAGPALLKYLKEVIKTPVARSSRWVSTSIPQNKWDEPLAKYSSAEYHTNNLLNPVLFEEASALIPANAVLVEVAPHGLLQAILKRALSSCVNIPLTNRGHKDNAAFMLDAIGKLYMKGYNPKVQALYPKVEFPVSTGTPMLGHLIEWEHSEKWSVPVYVTALKKTAAACNFALSVHDDEHNYLRGHVVKGKNVYPYSAALMAVWDTFAMSLNNKRKCVSVQFKDVHLFVQPKLYDKRPLKLSVTLQKGNGVFEVSNEGMIVAKGVISLSEKSNDIYRLLVHPIKNDDKITLKTEDIYKLLYTRDYNYSGEFQSLQGCNDKLNQADVKWQNNWAAFIDGLIQFNLLRQSSDETLYPDYIRRLTIDVEKHKMESDGFDVLKAIYMDTFDCTRCGGVIVENVKFRELSVLKNNGISLKALQFAPHFPKDRTDETVALHIYLQIVNENINKEEISIFECIDDVTREPKFNDIHKIIEDVPKLRAKYSVLREDKLQELADWDNIDVIFVNNLYSNEKLRTLLGKKLLPNTFIVNKECTSPSKQITPLFSVVCNYGIGNQFIQLIQWNPKATDTAGTSVYTLERESDVEHLYSSINMLPIGQRILLIASYPTISNLDNAAENIRKTGRPVNVIVINDDLKGTEEFPKCNLAKVMLNQGEWGGLYYLPINELPKANNNVILQSAQIGDINSLEWVEAPEVTGPGINVNVHYAGVNDIDIKRASGEVSYANVNKNYYGMDFSGVTDNGVRVMGLVKGGAITSRVKANSNLLWPVPDTWNLEDAATVPLAYAQAFYCLAIKQKLFPGMNILIHGGTGALGQAAISICLAHNCEVFTTVSDKSKKHFLKRLFPKLKDDHIGNSRDVTFGDMVLSCTQGYGCDIILNCVKGELKNISIKCCAPSGIVIDTGMVQTNEDFSYGMYNMTKSRSFAAVDISSIFKYNNETDMKHLQVLISEGIARGYVRPLTRLTFAPSDAARAFRLLAASRHRGRVLIDMKQNIPNTKTSISSSSNNYHIVVSDNDVLAIHLIERLIEKGVRKVQLICSKKSNSLVHKIRVWEKKGVHIELTIESVWEKNVTFNTLDDNSPSEVEGIYAIITNNNNSENIISSLDNLDAKARKIDSKLKYFAVINENHMIGENICLVRRNCNLPATFIKIPLLKQNDNGQSLSTKNVFDAIERAILSKKATTIAHISSPSTHLLQEICTLAEIKLPEVADDDTTLNQLRVESSKVSILQAYLRDQYDIWFEKDTILDLTVQKLREIQEMIFEKDFVRTKGLATFYSSVDRDELLATTEINFLPTLTNSSAMAHNEFDASQVFLCTVPGVEGNHARFSVLCERLKLPALVLQPPLGYAEDLHTMAQRFAEKFLQLTELKKFYLLGYESGVIVALEMAAILEKHGLTGVVFCLGGLPNEIQAQFETQLIEYKDEDALQEEICRHMMTLITESKTEMFENMFHKAMAWPEKLNACARSLLGKVEHSAEYTKELIESAYSRIAHVRNYVVEPKKLKSKLILLRPKMDISDEFQGMVEKDSPQNYSEQPIVEYQLDAPLANATQDMRCAAIVNRHLEEGILKAFEQKNLCKTYFLTQDSSV